MAWEHVHNVLNYFHKDESLDRATFGLARNKNSFWYKAIAWRATDVVLLAVLYVLYLLAYDLQPFQRQFVANDPSISHPFAERERVNNTELFIYAVWIPLCIILAVGLIFTKPKNKIFLTYVTILGLGVSTLSTNVLTDVLKNFIGRHRPDFIARCVLKPDTPKDVLVYAKDVCTTDNINRLLDGFRTTPSGHSSLSFAGLLYLSYFLAGQLVALNQYVGAWRVIVSGLPTLGAALIALSRTEDYRHHFVDIIIGSIIGSLIASWSYFRLYPSLADPKSYELRVLVEPEAPEDPVLYDRIDEQV